MVTEDPRGRALDILVLMGGPSIEREVSLMTGRAIAEALESRGHRVRRADIGPTSTAALDASPVDVVFIALHGEFGEDGQVQHLCEQRQLTYVGSPPHASELAMDKAASKRIYRRLGLKTPDWVVIEEFDEPAKRAGLLGEIGPPCVLKPIDGGSSVDIMLARDSAACDRALEALLDRYGRAMVERLIEGKEVTVGVLGDRALPVVEIRFQGEFYDYTAKYDDEETQYLVGQAVGLDAAATAQLESAALAAHRGLGCRDMSRSDFLIDPNGVQWLLETNTIPGFTSHSLLPKAAAEAGLSFADMCQELVQMAMQRKGAGDPRDLPARSLTH